MVTTYGYTQGYFTSVDYSDTTPDVAVTYDSLGRRSNVTQTNQSQIAYVYDPTNLRLDTETIRYDFDHNGSYEFTRVIDRSRDTLNRDSGFQLLSGSTVETQAAYQYDPATGRLKKVLGLASSSLPSPEFTYSYLPNSDLIQTITSPVHTTTNIYEPDRDVLDTKQNKVGTDVISSYDYSVNAIGQRTGVNTSGTAFPATPSWLWGYDSLGQVTKADSSVDTSDRAFDYDTIGNRLQSSAGVAPASSTVNYTANALNQYSQITSNSITSNPEYDADGNQTTAQVQPLASSSLESCVYSWDAENRLISTTVTTTVGTASTNYQYDAFSRRIAQTTGSNITAYLYDGWNCIAEYSYSSSTQLSATNPQLQKTRLWGTDLSGTLQGAGGVGGLLCETINNQPSTLNYFPTYDGNGNVSEYLTSTGTIAAHFEYDPFGNTVVNTDTAGLFNYRFSTKPLDSETGLYYYGYRYYDPQIGRWPSRDPIEEEGGVNLYGYVGGNPLNFFDPDGRDAYPTGDGWYNFRLNPDHWSRVNPDTPPWTTDDVLRQMDGRRVNHPNPNYTGQCATGAQAMTGAPGSDGRWRDAAPGSLRSWRVGPSVASGSVAKGTMIARGWTESGGYAGANGHTGIYMGIVNGVHLMLAQNSPHGANFDPEKIDPSMFFEVRSKAPYSKKPSECCTP
ncbi:MAG: RHS repeat-associated core domain-containing protein [Luteolibacter sp.]